MNDEGTMRDAQCRKPKWYLTFSASAAGNDWFHANPVARAA